MGTENPNEVWHNWAGNLSVRPVMHCHPTSLDDVTSYIQEAERAGRRVRAVGSGWSFSEVAVTPDYLIETDGLKRVLTTVLPYCLNETASRTYDGLAGTTGPGGGQFAHGSGRYLVHVEAGIKLAALMEYLDSNGCAPLTMGGSDGQALAGALSTSVHGADFDRGPISEMVRAIHLVGPGGRQHWIEPAAGVTDPARVMQKLGLDQSSVHYDDDWFNAALVSVGCLGVIYSVVIEVRKQYDLVQERKQMVWTDARALLVGGGAFRRTFGGRHPRFLQIDIDPAPPHTAYLTTRFEDAATGRAPTGAVTEALAVFCQTRVFDVLLALAPEKVVLDAANALVPGGAEIVLADIRSNASGALGDLIGSILNRNPTLAAQVVSTLTASLQDLGTKRGWAHTIMAPANPGECVARGRGLAIGFDATNDAYLSFIDEAVSILDAQFAQGFVLGGWFSLRFAGRSRAYLSPQRFDRTCMAEFVGLRTMEATDRILGLLADAGRRLNGIQHWGMCIGLQRQDVLASYPSLDAWRRIRCALTDGGRVHTFDNTFAENCGLTERPAPISQQNWRFCHRCQSLTFAVAPGVCPAGGAHDPAGSWDYLLTQSAPCAAGQPDWRFCRKCSGISHAAGGRCPAGGDHDRASDPSYTLLIDPGQADWRYCRKCHQLTFGEGGSCAAGDVHDRTGSWDYCIPTHGTPISTEAGWKFCSRCRVLTTGEGGPCAGGGSHDHRGSASYWLPIATPDAIGQADWKRCKACRAVTHGTGGRCVSGAGHDHSGSAVYCLPTNLGQGGWRWCSRCGGLWYNGASTSGVCPAGGGHESAGSGNYVLPHQ